MRDGSACPTALKTGRRCGTKTVYIAEKPSVARAFAAALGKNFRNSDGYMEADDTIVTWCVGHLVSMSYPDAYDASLKKWSLATIPFIPSKYKYQVIDGVKKQFGIVKRILTDPQVGTIYICTDSGREGEYIYRLVASQAGVKGKKELRVWIDSQTEAEILRGIREAKPSSAYDNLGSAAYLRAQEDYLMGINFSRALTLRYSDAMSRALGNDHTTIAVGRVMTCVLGMVVKREREIRSFVKTPFFRIQAEISRPDGPREEPSFTAQWQADEKSICYGTPRLYKDTGFLKKEDAEKMILYLAGKAEADIFSQKAGSSGAVNRNATEYPADSGSHTGMPPAGIQAMEISSAEMQTAGIPASGMPAAEQVDALPLKGFREAADSRVPAVLESIQRKKEKKNPPLLYNLAELQNDCSRMFHISPDQTLTIVQSLYEHKLTTYPRTDARVLSSAVAKVIRNNIAGLGKLGPVSSYINEILAGDAWKKIGSTRYTNDKAITDHYALIPTGQGMNETGKLNSTEYAVYLCIVRRFLSIFYPPAQYKKIALTVQIGKEQFFSNFRVLTEEGYLKAAQYKKPDLSENKDRAKNPENAEGADSSSENADSTAGASVNPQLLQALERLRSGGWLDVRGYRIRESETTPPKRYNSGTMILAMENAGSLIEDESLREQIRGAGIGTSATRADILKKLVNNRYIALNKKTQILTPTQLGEMIYDVVSCSIAPLLRPDLTASWEKGLNYVSDGSITPEEYMDKLTGFVIRRTNAVKELNNQGMLRQAFNSEAKYYKQWKPTSTWNNEKHSSSKKGESNGKK